jgi:hypothetical protein
VVPSASIEIVNPKTSSPMIVSAPTAKVSSMGGSGEADPICDPESEVSEEMVMDIDMDEESRGGAALDTDPFGVDCVPILAYFLAVSKGGRTLLILLSLLYLFLAGVPSNPIPGPFFFINARLNAFDPLVVVVVVVVFSLLVLVLVAVLVLPLLAPLFHALNPLAETIPYSTFSFLVDPNPSRRGIQGGDGRRERDDLDRPVGVVWRCDMFPSLYSCRGQEEDRDMVIQEECCEEKR